MSFTNVAADRRTFLKLTGMGLLAVSGAGSLAGCGQKEALQASNASAVKLPTYVPVEALKPDLPGTAQGVPAAYFNYPSPPTRTVTTPPLKGETFSAITNIFGAPPNPREKNPTWQAIEERLGGKLDITAVSSDDFKTKVNTTIAGNDIPDLILDDGASIPDIIGFLEAKCQDLTPFLSGDAIKEYPNLAAIPEIFWKQTVRAGKIYTLPIPRSPVGGLGIYRSDRFAEVGITDTSQIKNADEYLEVMKQLTNAQAGRWAFGTKAFGMSTFLQLFGAPNQWRESGGKLTYYLETEEYLEAVSFVRKAAAAGYIVPGSESWTNSQRSNAFISGQVAQIYDGMPAYVNAGGYGTTIKDAKPFLPFAAGGGKPIAWLDNILFASTMVKRNDEQKIRSLLGVANFLAAPFGSEEFMLLNYGLEGTDHTRDDRGNPVAKASALANTSVPWKFLVAPDPALYVPQQEALTRNAHAAYSTLVPLGVENPTSTLFSPTNARKGGTLRTAVSDTVTDHITGRKTLDDVKSAIQTWRTGGGDQIRAEYEQALAG
ncbi:extracellular solute-binding protein [Enemella evansiae]|uniref:Extracellular solute-binding protein n=1 Tax=Enemella evansiae TaxID=2016499 RepID=A0A255FYL0_9ACTN|nr:extracellular solute-binding protein [Enemella evansiae]OYO08769.1 hypothetical protein CGZ94_19890 [Enemella evansiae]OYO11311.1 hypothetical protein BI335_15810 [Enemella evansiae]TDO87932.1 carbohydrate ABC transporter substrate-binding protein (CUT1 family) [Enemella evansiae]